MPTETRRVSLILNTGAGTGCGADDASRLQKKFADAGIQAQVRCVQDGEHIAAEVRSAITGADHAVVAAGGDGTVSAVAAGLVDTPTCLGSLYLTQRLLWFAAVGLHGVEAAAEPGGLATGRAHVCGGHPPALRVAV